MTLKEAVLKSLEDINNTATYMEVYNHIINRQYYKFISAQTPSATISATLGDFIRNGDSRVKRIKEAGGSYTYYLTKNEENIGLDVLSGTTETTTDTPIIKTKTYDERNLH